MATCWITHWEFHEGIVYPHCAHFNFSPLPHYPPQVVLIPITDTTLNNIPDAPMPASHFRSARVSGTCGIFLCDLVLHCCLSLPCFLMSLGGSVSSVLLANNIVTYPHILEVVLEFCFGVLSRHTN